MMKRLKTKHLEIIRRFQCEDCEVFDPGVFPDCFVQYIHGLGCGRHVASQKGDQTIFKGLPAGFNRMGTQPPDTCEFLIFDTLDRMESDWEEVDAYSIVVAWKYLYKEAACTLMRLYRPRFNEGVIVLVLEDCMSRVGGKEITDDLLKKFEQVE